MLRATLEVPSEALLHPQKLKLFGDPIFFKYGFVHVFDAPDVHETDEFVEGEGAPFLFVHVEIGEAKIVGFARFAVTFRTFVFGDESRIERAVSLTDSAVFFPEGEGDDVGAHPRPQPFEIPCVLDDAGPCGE